MKQVEWLSPERVIPDHGVATTGQLISLPDDLADKFIAQGEARMPVHTYSTRPKAEPKGGDV
jgi:hypothetical protein